MLAAGASPKNSCRRTSIVCRSSARNLIEFDPGAVVPLHVHPHKQLGILLRGVQALVVDRIDHPLGPMEGYARPGGVEQSAYWEPEGATVVDVFQPVREDYRERAAATR